MRLAVAVWCAVMALAVSGCGSEDPDAGTNGLGKLSASKIHEKTRGAAGDATSVRLSGTVVSGGKVFNIDMRLTDKGGTGEVSSKGGAFSLLRIDKELYLKASSKYWVKQGGEREAAKKLDGKYVVVPTKDAAYAQLSGFTDMELLLDGLLDIQGKIERGERSEVGEVRTIQLTGDGGKGGTLDVSLEGEPYPLRLARAGNAGELKLSQWEESFSLAPPKKDEVVDYGKTVTD